MKEYSKPFLHALLRMMIRIRRCEENLIEPILQSEVKCPVHLYSGQEAVAAGLCASLKKRDYVFGNHRSHGHFLAKGGCMKELIAEIYCKQTGCSRGRGGSMHLIDPAVGMLGAAPIVAGTISLALGAALATFIRKEDRVAVSFFGDGATGEGVLYESMNFASLKGLPIIFACENNLYATHMPIRECRIGIDIYKVAEPFCIQTQVVDGNDVIAVYEAGKAAVARCRNSEGPVFLEFRTYRIRGHVGPDDNIQGSHTDIRPKEEINQWLQRDPIVIFENNLMENRLLEVPELKLIREEAELEVAEAIAFAKSSLRPGEDGLRAYVYR
jgi:acetoin:2,6-dichlorophenolindophenol oxidoreductase subunit alpha